ncbi:hypothetical protein THIOSC15_2320002 [uncultured Thiomicrorhabdus sp.]
MCPNMLCRIYKWVNLFGFIGTVAKPLPATISYISNVAEFTPPLIFSQKFRQKLVYLIEAKLSDGQLRPGQPVDVSLPSETSAND